MYDTIENHIIERDIFCMNEALKLAEKSFSEGQVPVGAVMYDNLCGKIVGKGRNFGNRKAPTRHAEEICIENACKALNYEHLNNCIMYVTLEPCIMCLGASINARVGEIIFGAYSNDNGALWTKNIFETQNFAHVPGFRGGLMEKECSEILSRFFGGLRK